MTSVKLSSTNDAIDYLTQYLGKEECAPEVIFGGELANLHATIEGKSYHGSVPGELARGLVELQDEFYRAAAFALHGNDSIKSLTAEERATFQLVFEVKEGSSEIDAQLGVIWSKLGDGFIKMKSEHKVTVLVSIVLFFALGWTGDRLYETHAGIEKARIEADADKEREVEKTRQMTLISDLAAKIPEAERFAKASTEGARAVIKGARDADVITLNNTRFDKDAIEEINQRAAKDKADAKVLTADFRIVGLESRDKAVKLWLEADGIKQFSVIVNDDEDADADLLHTLWTAARERKLVRLEVSATYIRGQLKAAQVIRHVPKKSSLPLHSPAAEQRQLVAITRP